MKAAIFLSSLLCFASAGLQAAIVAPIVNGSFEADAAPSFGNNLSANPPTGWSTSVNGANNNVVRVDGSTTYIGGPNSAQDGTRYFDMSGDGYLWQAFTLDTNVYNFTFGAWFSSREAGGGNTESSVSIWSSDDWTNSSPISSASATFSDGTDADTAGTDAVWKQATATIAAMAAGTYYIRINLENFNNVDSVYGYGTAVPEPAGLIVGSLLVAGLISRRARRLPGIC